MRTLRKKHNYFLCMQLFDYKIFIFHTQKYIIGLNLSLVHLSVLNVISVNLLVFNCLAI